MNKITSIEPFIDLGLYTVPLNGKQIARNELGKKHGFSFPSNWQESCSTEQNTIHSQIGGLLTGELGDTHIVAIDCDDTYTYELFRQLDTTNTAFFESIGKVKLNTDGTTTPISSCTILYKSIPNLPTSKKLKGKHDLDWYNGTGMVFLPTEANQTKDTWYIEDNNLYNHNKDLVVIKAIPNVVAEVLKLLLEKDTTLVEVKSIADTIHSRRSKGFLGKLLDNYNFKDMEGEYEPAITKVLTPKEYRTELFNKQGHIHPNDIGVRHDYLFKVMCILAGDNTVDKDTARDCIMWINSLLTPPRSPKQMDREIIAGIISGRQHNQNDEPYWQYDENWESLRSWTAITKTGGDLVDIFYDQFRKDYFIYNTYTDHIMQFTKKGEIIEHVQATSIDTFNQKEAISDMNNVETLIEAKSDFGYLDNDKQFNLFKPTEALRILSKPSLHKSYKEPTEFINYIEHFIPNEQQRNYFLALIRRKLTTFDYSPVVPYIIGVPGSGKGIIMSILERIMGSEYVSKEVSGGLFTSQFNKGWLENKYFVNLNELAEGLQNKADRQRAIGDLKIYTGGETFQCHGKGRDPYTAPQRAMFIMTANQNPLAIDDNDRRIYYIGTPNTFDSSPQCLASTSSSDIYYAIMNQVDDICYWLSTEVGNLPNNQYTTAPHHSGRAKIIFDSLPIAEKIVWAISRKEYKLVEELLPNPIPFFSHAINNIIYVDSLVECYNQIGSYEGIDKSFKALMNRYGYRQNTTRGKVYWKVEGMDYYGDYETSEDIDLEDKQHDKPRT